MRHKSRLDKLEEELIPERPIYQIRSVESSEEARQIAEEEGYEPWQPGDRPRFIIWGRNPMGFGPLDET